MARQIADSWLFEYLRYTAGQESPDVYHLWSALTIIGAALERNVGLDRGFHVLYPNLYTILVGGSAIVRKTTAINIAIDILKEIQDPPMILAQKVTPEAVIQAMAARADRVDDTKMRIRSAAVIYAPELSVFLGRAAYESGMLALLTAIYDNPKDEWVYETKSAGRFPLYCPCLTLIGATTPEWMKTSIPSDAIGGGFLSRCVLVYADRPKALIPFPEMSADLRERHDRLVHDLSEIRMLRGTFTVDAEARQWYSAWYAVEMEKILGSNIGEFIVRRPDILLKLGMIISAAQNDSLVITRPHLEIGAAALDQVHTALPDAISNIVTIPTSEAAAKVLDVIRRRGRIEHRDLQGLCWRFANREVLAQALQTLEDGGLILVERGPRGGRTYVASGSINSKIENTAKGGEPRCQNDP